MIFVLFILLLFLLWFNYLVFKKEFFSPAVLLCAFACVCVFFCLFNYNNWELKSFSFKTTVVILLALVSFSLASKVTMRITFSRRKVNRPGKVFTMRNGYCNAIAFYRIPNYFTLFVSAFMLVIMYQYYKEISYIGEVGRSIYSIKTYPLLWYVKNIDTGMSVNFITSNLVDIGFVFSYLYIYFFIYNVTKTHKVKKYLIYLIPIMIYAIQSVMFGGRTGLLQMVTLIIVLKYYIEAGIKKEKYSKIFKNNLKKIVPALIVVLAVFWYLNDVSGRVATTMSPVYYISLYVGSGIKNLDTFLNDFQWKNFGKGFGWETFSGIYSFLKHFFNISYDGLVLEYQDSINGLFMGNVYTSLRRFYHDFGYIGVIVLPFIMGCVISSFSKGTRKIMENLSVDSKWTSEAKTITYGILVYSIVLFFIEDFFFMNVISLNLILKIIELYIANWLLLQLKIVKRVGIGSEHKNQNM